MPNSRFQVGQRVALVTGLPMVRLNEGLVGTVRAVDTNIQTVDVDFPGRGVVPKIPVEKLRAA